MRNLIEWNQHEGTLGQPWVRNLERGASDNEIAKEKNIQIEGARAVLKIENAIATKIFFDQQQGAQQFERGQISR